MSASTNEINSRLNEYFHILLNISRRRHLRNDKVINLYDKTSRGRTTLQGREVWHLKAWNKLPKIQHNVLLFGGVGEDGNIPEECTEEILSILSFQNGAQVEQYLCQSMQEHNMSLEPRFFTALNKGILVSPDDASTPKNFTPFLTPPVGDDDEDDDNAKILKLAV